MSDKLGCRHLYYGDGKGKTTAAVGLAVRALGQGVPVVFVQFLKNDKSGELEPLRRLGAAVYCGPAEQKFTFRMNDDEKAECARLQNERLDRASYTMLGSAPGLLVLDEAVDAAGKGFLSQNALQTLLADFPGWEIVLTGHSAPDWALAACDYVTHFSAEKHPYKRGLAARKGIEY